MCDGKVIVIRVGISEIGIHLGRRVGVRSGRVWLGLVGLVK